MRWRPSRAGDRGCAVRQPVPLHRLSAHRRRGAGDVRRARRARRVAGVRHRAPTARARRRAGRGAAGGAIASHRWRARNASRTRRTASAGGRRARVDALAALLVDASGRAHRRRRHRRRTVDHQASSRPRRHRLHGRRRGPARDPRDADAPCDRRGGVAHRRLCRARCGVARAARGVGAVRLGADPQQRHARRQRRQRLADRRFDARADRARRHRRAAPRRRHARARRSRTCISRYQKTALAAGRVRGARFASRIARPASLLRAYKVSKRYDQDISAVFACFALHARRRSHRQRRASAAAAWRATPKRATAHRSRARGPAVERRDRRRRGARCSAASSRRSTTCAPAAGVPPRARSAISCAASGSKPAAARVRTRIEQVTARVGWRLITMNAPAPDCARRRRRDAVAGAPVPHDSAALHVAGRGALHRRPARAARHAARGARRQPDRARHACAASTLPRCARRPAWSR